MAGFSTTFECFILNYLFRSAGNTHEAPSNMYIALGSSSDGEDQFTEIDSSVASSYARVEVLCDGSGWTQDENIITNANNIDFPQAAENWGLITHFALFDAATEGNMISIGTLSGNRNILPGDLFRFPAGNISFTLN